MIRYKINIIEKLSEAGYNTTRLRKEKIISEATLTRIRKQDSISTNTIDTICLLLDCQPGDLIEVIKE